MIGFLISAVTGVAAYIGLTGKDESPVAHPYETTSQSTLNLTTVTGYLILAGMALYFGKRVLK
jgi:hypothetical protein